MDTMDIRESEYDLQAIVNGLQLFRSTAEQYLRTHPKATVADLMARLDDEIGRHCEQLGDLVERRALLTSLDPKE